MTNKCDLVARMGELKVENANLKARNNQLKAALNIAVEQEYLKNAERRLITEDVDINRIIQTHLENGTWVLGSEGYLATPGSHPKSLGRNRL